MTVSAVSLASMMALAAEVLNMVLAGGLQTADAHKHTPAYTFFLANPWQILREPKTEAFPFLGAKGGGVIVKASFVGKITAQRPVNTAFLENKSLAFEESKHIKHDKLAEELQT